MTTKEKFLRDVKAAIDKYHVKFHYKHPYGIPNGHTNNVENYSMTGIKVQIPDENMDVLITGKEFIKYMCNES